MQHNPHSWANARLTYELASYCFVSNRHSESFRESLRSAPLWAVTANHIPLFDLLVSETIDLSLRYRNGSTLLHEVVVAPQRNYSLISTLISKGLDPNATRDNGETPLDYALGLFSNGTLRDLTGDLPINFNMIVLLLQAGADFQKVPHEKIRCALEALKVLVNSFTRRDMWQFNVLFTMTTTYQGLLLSRLRVDKVDEIPDTFLNAVLLAAIALYDDTVVQSLLDHGADMNFKVKFWDLHLVKEVAISGLDIVLNRKPTAATKEEPRILTSNTPWFRNQVVSRSFSKLTGRWKKKGK